tara:strand:+ start:7878 stop:9617 length:1740 start_codon:yes stop_codon:yes gene_type:complete
MNSPFFLTNKISRLPKKTGVYIFLNKKKEVIYVGKSVNIRGRINSYLKSTVLKDKLLIKNCFFVEYFLVGSEKDALFLENNLIKTHKPKYNILLKDDKSFPWICIKNERFPRVFITRKKRNENDFYFGPYVSTKNLNTLYKLISKLFPIRSCNFLLSEKNVENKKYSVCLDYHLNRCGGPCENLQSEEEYNYNIDLIKKILKGDFSFVLNKLEKKLKYYSSHLLFEKAEVVKNQILSLKSIKNKSIIVVNKKVNLDAFYITSYGSFIYINFLRVAEGGVVFLKNTKIKNNNLFSKKHFLKRYINKTFIDYGYLSKSIISNISIDSILDKKIVVPKKGYKKDILKICQNNISNYIKRFNYNNYDLLKNLQTDLNLNNFPFHIECFDISNLQGTNTVSSCVVFKNGKPVKKEYKFFNLKKINFIDDYFSIEESLKLRYFDNFIFPDLIIIDGGKGQLNSAKKIISKIYKKNIDVISIAKRKEIIFNYYKSFTLSKRSNSLKFIQKIRDEAHRFCLKNHRLLRTKKSLSSELFNIKGVGKKTYLKLINKYKSLNNIKNLEKAEIESFLGKKRGSFIYMFFNK